MSLSKAIDQFGSQAALARALEVTPQAVTKWIEKGVPLKRAIEIERLTKGDVSCNDLRPDVFHSN